WPVGEREIEQCWVKGCAPVPGTQVVLVSCEELKILRRGVRLDVHLDSSLAELRLQNLASPNLVNEIRLTQIGHLKILLARLLELRPSLPPVQDSIKGNQSP